MKLWKWINFFLFKIISLSFKIVIIWLIGIIGIQSYKTSFRSSKIMNLELKWNKFIFYKTASLFFSIVQI